MRDNPLAKKVARLRRQLARLGKKKPQLLSGRHMYIKVMLAQGSNKRSRGLIKDKTIGKTVLKLASQKYKSLPLARRQHYESEAVLARVASAEKRMLDMMDLRTKLQRAGDDITEEANDEGCFRMRDFRFSGEEMVVIIKVSVGCDPCVCIVMHLRAQRFVGNPMPHSSSASSCSPCSAPTSHASWSSSTPEPMADQATLHHRLAKRVATRCSSPRSRTVRGCSLTSR